MTERIPSSIEVLDDFFANLSNRKELHQPTIQSLVELHKKGKLSAKNAANMLAVARENKGDGQNQ